MPSNSTPEPNRTPSAALTLARRHVRIGWWSVLIFLCLGAVLEGIHLFRGEEYRQTAHEMTRLMWRLAHVHGALLGLVHIAFGVSVSLAVAWSHRSRTWASYCLISASLLLPGGFFAGGVFAWDGDPSLGVILVPLGAGLLFVGVLLTARGVNAIE